MVKLLNFYLVLYFSLDILVRFCNNALLCTFIEQTLLGLLSVLLFLARFELYGSGALLKEYIGVSCSGMRDFIIAFGTEY